VPGPAFSDAEFIELWRTHRSPSKIAEITGIGIRALKGRRRRVEQRLGINLEVDSPKAEKYSHLRQAEYKFNHDLGLLNGQVIDFSDAHFWPQIRTTAYKGVLKLIRELKPKAVINGGDAFDGAQISRFPRAGFLDQGPTVKEELKACKDRLEEIEEAAAGAKLVWCLGNHDIRFESRLAANVPQFEGINGFHLKDHFPKWIPAWNCWINEGTVVSHRWKNGVHATYTNVVNAGVNIVTGHLHALKWAPFTDLRGVERYGVDSGTLAEPMGPQFVNYLEGKHPNWGSGFVVLTFKDGRMLEPQFARTWDRNHIQFRGELINVSGE
jgi:hypothetical protein